MSDGMSYAARQMQDARARRVRFDAACFALATHLGLDTTSKEDYRDMDDWNRADRPKPLGLVRVAVSFENGYEIYETAKATAEALERGDLQAWRAALEIIRSSLGINPDDLIVADTNKPIYDYDAWARLMVTVAGTHWVTTFIAASPFAGRTLIYVRRDNVGIGRLCLEPGAHTAAIEYLEALARSDGNHFVVEFSQYKDGPIDHTVSVLALPRVE
jgi:hypothetical protein